MRQLVLLFVVLCTIFAFQDSYCKELFRHDLPASDGDQEFAPGLNVHIEDNTLKDHIRKDVCSNKGDKILRKDGKKACSTKVKRLRKGGLLPHWDRKEQIVLDGEAHAAHKGNRYKRFYEVPKAVSEGKETFRTVRSTAPVSRPETDSNSTSAQNTTAQALMKDSAVDPKEKTALISSKNAGGVAYRSKQKKVVGLDLTEKKSRPEKESTKKTDVKKNETDLKAYVRVGYRPARSAFF